MPVPITAANQFGPTCRRASPGRSRAGSTRRVACVRRRAFQVRARRWSEVGGQHSPACRPPGPGSRGHDLMDPSPDLMSGRAPSVRRRVRGRVPLELGEHLAGDGVERGLLVGERVETSRRPSARARARPARWRCGRRRSGRRRRPRPSSAHSSRRTSPALHPRDVVGEPAALPRRAPASSDTRTRPSAVVGELHQHVEVLQRQVGVRLQPAVQRGRQLVVDRQPVGARCAAARRSTRAVGVMGPPYRNS